MTRPHKLDYFQGVLARVKVRKIGNGASYAILKAPIHGVIVGAHLRVRDSVPCAPLQFYIVDVVRCAHVVFLGERVIISVAPCSGSRAGMRTVSPKFTQDCAR
jgi:hypothetical protein